MKLILFSLVSILVLLHTGPAFAAPLPLTLTLGSLHVDFDFGTVNDATLTGPGTTLTIPSTRNAGIPGEVNMTASAFVKLTQLTPTSEGELTLTNQPIQGVIGTLTFTGGVVTFQNPEAPFTLDGLLTNPGTGASFTVSGVGEAFAGGVRPFPNGGFQSLTFTLASVPEPSGLLLVTSGLIFLTVARWRRSQPGSSRR